MSRRFSVVWLAALLCLAAAALSSHSTPATQGGQAPAPKTGPVKPPTTDAGKIRSALSAAPAAVTKDATVMDMGTRKVLRQGTNGWTCLPDGPSPGLDPMCLDKNGMEWADAWMKHAPPPAGKMGIGYMLAGGSDASNTDPFATTPNPGDRWVDTGPHLMVLNIGDAFAGYPTTATNTKVPYVMFANTPYAHLMIPVK
jgi:hypothetical protein